MKKLLFAILFSICIFVINGYATTINGISSFNVNGAQMAGMEVSVIGTTNSNATWAATGGVTGGASGTGWSLVNTGSDTFFDRWSLVTDANTFIDTITINSVPGNIYFDIFMGLTEATTGLPPGVDSTFNSRNGWWDEIGNQDITTTVDINGTTLTKTADSVSVSNNQFTWTFSDAIATNTNGGAAVGDLFGFLTIDFSGNGFNSFSGVTSAEPTPFTFRLDTDLDISQSPVPEPSTILLFGLGLLGFGAIGRRKKA